jgi:hypothetical protein
MAVIYLAHSTHGVKVATMELEAQQDEENGWVRMDAEDLADPSLMGNGDDDTMRNQMPRRRGRPRLNKDD